MGPKTVSKEREEVKFGGQLLKERMREKRGYTAERSRLERGR